MKSTCALPLNGFLRSCFLLIAIAVPLPASAAAEVEPASDLGTIYLYRQSAFFARGTAFDVLVDGRKIGELKNSSFLALRAAPGKHRLTVVPFFAAKKSDSLLNFEAGATQYLEYTFATGPFANNLFVGSAIEPRDRAQAAAELAPLENVAGSDAVLLSSRPAFAEVGDVDAVPNLSEAGKAGYRDWLSRTKPRAFVLSPKGSWNAGWGFNPANRVAADPTERALRE